MDPSIKRMVRDQPVWTWGNASRPPDTSACNLETYIWIRQDETNRNCLSNYLIYQLIGRRSPQYRLPPFRRSGLDRDLGPDASGYSRSQEPTYPNSQPRAIRLQWNAFQSGLCSRPCLRATRISLQTGKSPAQLHWTKASRPYTAADGYKLVPPANIRNIPESEITIGERLQSAGYATAHYGKWHIMGGGPEKHGYDESDGETSNNDAAPHKGDNPVDIFGMGRRAAAFMEKHSRAGKPFFIQMSYHALHYPENAKPATVEKYRKILTGASEKAIGRAAIAENLDEGVGLLLEKIDALGIAENTYVVYMSDNGGGGNSRSRPISGGKGDVREGGIRVPLIIRGPGIDANSWSHQAVVGYDLYNTFSELAGITAPMPANTEGGSFVHLLKGMEKPVKRPREELVFHFPHYQGDTPHSAILLGDYKLLHYYETGESQLYHLASDLKESNDLSQKIPEKAAELNQRLSNYLAAIGADLPACNPQFDPANPPRVERVAIVAETGKEEATASAVAKIAGFAKTKIDPRGPIESQ